MGFSATRRMTSSLTRSATFCWSSSSIFGDLKRGKKGEWALCVTAARVFDFF